LYISFSLFYYLTNTAVFASVAVVTEIICVAVRTKKTIRTYITIVGSADDTDIKAGTAKYAKPLANYATTPVIAILAKQARPTDTAVVNSAGEANIGAGTAVRAYCHATLATSEDVTVYAPAAADTNITAVAAVKASAERTRTAIFTVYNAYTATFKHITVCTMLTFGADVARHFAYYTNAVCLICYY